MASKDPDPPETERCLSLSDRYAYRRLEDVGGCKQSTAGLAAIARGGQGPGQLERSIPGISTKVLNERLTKMGDYFLITRREIPGKVPRRECALTPAGEKLSVIIESMRDLDEEHGLAANMKKLEIVGIQIGMPRTLGTADAAEPMDREWTTGFYKEPVEGSLWVTRTGITGDGQADLSHHGGPDKAINGYPLDHYAKWSAELELELPHGAFGENWTVSGLTEEEVCVGDIYGSGDLLVQVSQPRQPCWKLARRWRIKDLAARVERTGRTGWYFRVLKEGRIQAGAVFALVGRPSPRWSIAAANEVMHRRKNDAALNLELAACPQLSASWQASLTSRGTSGAVSDSARLHGP